MILLFLDNGAEINELYWKTEQKCRIFTGKFLKFVFINQLMYVASLFFSIYCMIVGNFDTSTWILPFTLWVPFDTTNLPGWYLLLFIQFSMGMSYSMSQVLITAYFVCCCYYIGAICAHFVFVMKTLRADVEKNQNEKDSVAYQERVREIERKLARAVEIHCQAYEWVDIFEIYFDLTHTNNSI